MIPTYGPSFGRAAGWLRRYPGGTENFSIFATVRGSMPNRRAASRWLIPSIRTAYRTFAYSSTGFIPQPFAITAKSLPVPEFYSGAARPSGRFTEGFFLRRLQAAASPRSGRHVAARSQVQTRPPAFSDLHAGIRGCRAGQ